jgi:hypothetical protein
VSAAVSYVSGTVEMQSGRSEMKQKQMKEVYTFEEKEMKLRVREGGKKKRQRRI